MLGSIWRKLLWETLSGIEGRKKNVLSTWAVYTLNSPLLLVLRHLWHLHWADVAQNEGSNTFLHNKICLSSACSMRCLYHHGQSVRSLHFVFQMLFGGQSCGAIIPYCLQFTFYTSIPNVFHFVLASPFLHSWMTTRGMVPEKACLTSYLHVITGGHSTSIPTAPKMQQWWKTWPEVGSLCMFTQAGLWFVTITSCAYYDDT